MAGLHIGVVIATGYPLSYDAFSIFATAYALSVTATPCQLSQRESQGAGVARPAHRNHRIVKSAAQRVSRRKSGGAAALGSPYGGAGERSEPERAQAAAGLHIGALIATGYPLSHDTFSIFATAYALSVTAFSRASSPKGRAKGRASPARRRRKCCFKILFILVKTAHVRYNIPI